MCLLVTRTGLALLLVSQACPPPSGSRSSVGIGGRPIVMGLRECRASLQGEIRRLPRAGPQDGHVGLPIRGASPNSLAASLCTEANYKYAYRYRLNCTSSRLSILPLARGVG